MIDVKIDAKPLTVNRAWKGRRYKTPAYKTYERELFYLLKQHKLKKVEGWVEVKYILYLKHYRISDLGNFEKPLSDILVKAGLIDDDRFIWKMTLEKFKSDKDYIRIIIKKF